MHDTLVLPRGPAARGCVAAGGSAWDGVPGRLDAACAAACGLAARDAPGVDGAIVRLALALEGADDVLADALARVAAHRVPRVPARWGAAGPVAGDGDGAEDPGEADADEGFAPYWTAAAAALEAGRPHESVALLLAIALSPAGRADGLLGLAVCAARLGRHGDARVLALASRDAGASHPRALCVAGLCALREGDRRAAQSYLATAARVARRRSEFRDDLHLAQRQLLLMHLA